MEAQGVELGPAPHHSWGPRAVGRLPELQGLLRTGGYHRISRSDSALSVCEL